MPKRKRCEDIKNKPTAKRLHLTQLSNVPLRKSARLQEKQQCSDIKPLLPSQEKKPSLTKPFVLKTAQDVTSQDHIAFWSRNANWSQSFKKQPLMPEPAKRPRTTSHRSDEILQFQRNNIKDVPHRTFPNGVAQFASLLKIDRSPAYFPCYPAKQWNNVLDRVYSLSEERMRRDIGQMIVPSAENLAFSGETGLQSICEEVGAEWTRATKVFPNMKRSKPDFTAGLRPSAFTQSVYDKLEVYSDKTQPVQFPPGLCFPFLTAEAKCGEGSLAQAHRQNTGHGAIAVGALIRLYRTAFGTRCTDLYNKPLFFSISHNHQDVHIYAHFANLGSNNQVNFCHYLVKNYNLRVDGQQFGCFNFVLKVYQEFVPQHIKRIEIAAQALEQGQNLKHRVSFDASTQNSQDTESLRDSQTTEMDEDNSISPMYAAGIIVQLQETLKRQSEDFSKRLEQQNEEAKRRDEEAKRREEEARLREKELQELLTKLLASKN